MTLRSLTPAQIARGRAAGRALADNYRQHHQLQALTRWWLREIRGRYLGEV